MGRNLVKRSICAALVAGLASLSGCVSLPTYYDAESGVIASSEAEGVCREEANSMRSAPTDVLPPQASASAEGGALLGNSVRAAFEFRDAFEACMERRGYVRHG